jgi:hypothetical protein
MNHEKLWEAFSQRIHEHIKEKGRKYNVYDTAEAMSKEFWIDSIRKYVDELMIVIHAQHGNVDPGLDYSENLLSIAHIAAILYEKMVGPMYEVNVPPLNYYENDRKEKCR